MGGQVVMPIDAVSAIQPSMILDNVSKPTDAHIGADSSWGQSAEYTQSFKTAKTDCSSVLAAMRFAVTLTPLLWNVDCWPLLDEEGK
jgi:hypothetical protein